ncbi:MAG: 1-deoxy-D-xylulose-5-phosphate reductoisomerase [Bryobacteraceae bacterium]|nr:1-deoxy-D-xylulose-5-phosphate reductoisomerase [Bryobacteraceae bacterium]
MRSVTLLGSTGSIGTSALDVIRQWPELFRVHSLVAGKNTHSLALQIQEFRPQFAAVAEESDLECLRSDLRETGLERSQWPDLSWGPEARIAAATSNSTDIVLSAIVGIAGLEATYEAVKRGKLIALANKETLVAGGQLVMQAARDRGTEILPVDSEHNGAHQCLRAGARSDAIKLILTASGGPFRNTPVERLSSVTPAEALNHPTWKMGQRITIDSATLMNKGFEVIEACWLFDFAPRDVEVVVHPQSQVHAMVEYSDGSVIAQVCATDMRMPIQYAFTWPERGAAPVPRLDWKDSRHWDFFPPDFSKFPLLRLAYEAQETGGSSGCTLNAADEVAVEAFLKEHIPFPAIAEVVADTLSRFPQRTPGTVGEILEIDRESRALARECVRQRAAVQA